MYRMTWSQYRQYGEMVAAFLEREDIESLAAIYHPNTTDLDNESHFSHRRCECCNRPEAGKRFKAAGYNPETKEVLEYDICWDCLYYAAYGQLDDVTMREMKE